MSDQMQDFVIEFEIDDQREVTVWSGYTREGAIQDFQLAHPEWTVVAGVVEKGKE